MTPHSVPAPGGNSPVIRLDGVTKTYQPGAPAAVAFGATAVIFAFGLSSSLHRAAQSQSLSATVPVQVQPFGPGSGPGQAPTAAQDAAVTAALRAQPGTGHDVAVYTAQVKVPASRRTSSRGRSAATHPGPVTASSLRAE